MHLIVEEKEIANDLTQAANGHAMLIPEDGVEDKRGDYLSCSLFMFALTLNLNLLQKKLAFSISKKIHTFNIQ